MFDGNCELVKDDYTQWEMNSIMAAILNDPSSDAGHICAKQYSNTFNFASTRKLLSTGKLANDVIHFS